MTKEEAEALVRDLARSVIPTQFRWGACGHTLAVHNGWARLGESGIRAANIQEYWDHRQPLDTQPTHYVEVLVDGEWYDIGREGDE